VCSARLELCRSLALADRRIRRWPTRPPCLSVGKFWHRRRLQSSIWYFWIFQALNVRRAPLSVSCKQSKRTRSAWRSTDPLNQSRFPSSPSRSAQEKAKECWIWARKSWASLICIQTEESSSRARSVRKVAENIIWGKVVVSPESGPWWVKWVQGHPWLAPTPKGCRMSSTQLVVGFGCRTE